MPTPEFILSIRARIGHDLIHVPTVGALARDDAGRILLVQDRQDGRWTCPGGIVEPFELPADAVVRETWEEAGVWIEPTHVLGVFGGPDCGGTYENGDRIAWVATLFGARARGGVPKPDGTETSSARFLTAQEIASLPLKPHLVLFLAADNPTTQVAHFQPPNWQPPGVS